MQLLQNIRIIDLALFLEKEKSLIVSDFHVGYEECLNKQGILVPRFHAKDILEKLEKIIKKTKPETIIINGDLKHEFGTISEQEWRDVLKLLDLVIKYSKKVVLIKGNHDTIIGPIAKKRSVVVKKSAVIGDTLIAHGDKIIKLNKKVKNIIISHEHPAVSIRDDIRVEKYKCFLLGRYKNKNLIVMPSFNPLLEGTDMLSQETLSPYLHQNLDNFRVFVVSDKVYDFGKLGNL